MENRENSFVDNTVYECADSDCVEKAVKNFIIMTKCAVSEMYNLFLRNIFFSGPTLSPGSIPTVVALMCHLSMCWSMHSLP